MTRTAFPVWVHVAVAFAIAVFAFLVGQVAPGWGMLVVADLSTAWVVYVVCRGTSESRHG